jgi:hypothetical protein
MDKNYKYRFYLDSIDKPVLLETSAEKIDEFSPTVRCYYFDLPAVSGGKLVEDCIQYVETNCKSYKLILIGEHEGHMEIFQSEDYEGSLSVEIKLGFSNIPLWEK